MTSHQLVPRVNEKVSGNTAFKLVHKQKQKFCATEIFESELSISFMNDICIRLRTYDFSNIQLTQMYTHANIY